MQTIEQQLAAMAAATGEEPQSPETKDQQLLALLQQMNQKLEALQKENEELKLKVAQGGGPSSFTGIKVVPRFLGQKYKSSDGKETDGKGTIAVYGMGKMPVSLYPSQWLAVLLDEQLEGAEIPALRQTLLRACRADNLSWKRPEVRVAFLKTDLGK